MSAESDFFKREAIKKPLNSGVPRVPHCSPKGAISRKPLKNKAFPAFPAFPHEKTIFCTLQQSLRELYEERAAILEYEGGLTRREAERQARLIVYGK